MEELDDIFSDFKEDTPKPKPKSKPRKESPFFISVGEELPPGIYYQPPPKKSGDDWIEPPPLWLCEEFGVVARSRDSDSGNHGRVLEWVDVDRVRHELVITLDMLTGDGVEVRKLLMNGGLRVSTKKAAKELLMQYILETNPSKVARSVFAIGWQSGGAYVLPTQTFGG
ncbi:MAG: hypothetical protein BWK73_35120 [Thiothrix lacustris]|uniref:DUF927 domain-containing protein n=1 Tax=Thiothrix lacustris TaxID=525917 RepID=A0A1Y1QG37_9GAMM|nr:MAG: hypothetical protein BWK73_35120 [Thiothrix lacustris]